MSDQTSCNGVEAEECDAYEENQEEPVAMIEESPPDVGQDGLYNHKLFLIIFTCEYNIDIFYVISEFRQRFCCWKTIVYLGFWQVYFFMTFYLS